MTIVRCMHISDTHEENIADIVVRSLKERENRHVDILFHTGDLTGRGDIEKLKRCAEQFEDLILNGYVTSVVVIPGNHDKTFQKPKMTAYDKPSNWETPERARELFTVRSGVHLLIHEAIEIQGVKIFGSPWTPEFHNWAYNYFAIRAEALWGAIPLDTQVLMTHGPPEFILDEVQDWDRIRHTGCPVLARKIREIQSIRYHLFGHIHEGYGRFISENKQYLNSSIMNLRYKPTNKPQYFIVDTSIQM